ncbi:MAG: GNAT family N-acetyltransferase, partial [Planctomycetota bacterium]
DLMRTVLRDGAPIAEEYPLIFRPEFSGRVVTLEEPGSGVLATCALLVREARVGETRFRLGLIGSVATHPEHRGRGHASRVLARAEAEAAQAGCVCTLLWADEPGFYERRGYSPIGTEIDAVVTDADLPSLPSLPEPTAVREARTEDGPRLHELYSGHESRLERSLSEMLALLEIPGMSTLVRTGSNGLQAYACVGRGADLHNVVHEWGGPADDVLALLRAHLERRPASERELFVMLPACARELASALDGIGVPRATGILGMAKLVNVEAAAELFSTFLGGLGAVSALTTDPLCLEVRGPGGTHQLTAPETLLALLAPRGDRALPRVVEDSTGLSLPALPLAAFVWGLDSI